MEEKDWKNGTLSEALYEAAMKSLEEGPFGRPIPPMTPERRFKWQLEDYAYRLKRAAALLLGEDED